MPLPEQDRSRWDTGLATEGRTLVRRCLRRNRPGPYQIQAAIAAVRSAAADAAVLGKLSIFVPASATESRPQTSHHDRKDKAMTADDRNRATATVEDDGHEPADDT